MASGPLPEIDFMQFDYWQNPHAVLGPAREQSPIGRAAPIPLLDLPVPWVVLRHADVEALLIDSRLRGDYGGLQTGALGRLTQGLLGEKEGPTHSRLRGLVARAFTPRRIDDLRPAMRIMAQQRLQSLEPGMAVDFQSVVADELTVGAICGLLGIPEEDVARFGAWTGTVVPGANPIAPPELQAEAEQAAAQLYAYVGDLAERRRREPRNDLLDALIATEEAGERLSPSELEDMVLNLLIGGHDTLRSLLGISTMLLLQYPDAFREVCANRAKVDDAVEEALRFESPVMFVPRVANEALAVGDEEIPAGSTVLLALTSANRDPRRFAEPDRFDVSRGERADLAFGRGVHFCIGAALARAQAQEFLSVWSGHGRVMEVIEDPSWVPFAAISRRLQAVHVRIR